MRMRSTAILVLVLFGIAVALPNQHHGGHSPQVHYDSACPDPEAIKPCKCHFDGSIKVKPSLNCFYLKSIEEMKNVFQADFPTKDFKQLVIGFDSSEDSYLGGDILNGLRFVEIVMNLSYQNLSMSADFMMDSNETLEELFLDGGRFSHEDFPFASLKHYKRLNWFSIDSNDEISYLPPIVSESLANVRFNENPNLKSLAEGVFEGSPNITLFDLESNYLTSLPANAFKIKFGVETNINLWGNDIEDIHPEVFILPDYNNETVVNFRGDAQQFKIFDREPFQGLLNNTGNSYIDATYDPIVCNCSLAWVFDPSPTPLSYLSRIWGTCDNSTNFRDLNPAAYDDCL